MTIQRVTSLAARAAELLPEPPASHDAFGYLAWEELVLSTADRLARVAPWQSPTDSSALRVRLNPATGGLDAASLLALSRLRAQTGDFSECSLALADAVRDCDLFHRRPSARLNPIAS